MLSKRSLVIGYICLDITQWKQCSLCFIFTGILLTTQGLALEYPQDSWALTKEQIDMLRQADQKGYKASVLTGVVDNTLRTVVLLGEIHVKDETTHNFGKEILSLFPLRGLELIFTDNYLALAGMVPACCLLFLLYKLASFADMEYPSTITTAMDEADLEAPDGSLVLKKQSKESDADENTASGSVKNIHLEAGSGGFATFAGTSMLAGGLMFPFYTPLVVIGAVKILQNSYTPLSAAATLAGGYLILQMAGLFPITLKQAYGVDTKKLTPPLIFPLFYYLLEYRNQIMARNIHESFLERSDETTMLAIVGKAHMDGITEILITKFNFEKASY